MRYRETNSLQGNGSFGYEADGMYRNSYFFETFLEVGRQMRAVHLSAFAMYTVLHATGELDLQGSSNVPGAPAVIRFATFGIDRQNWIVGGKAVIGFASPL